MQDMFLPPGSYGTRPVAEDFDCPLVNRHPTPALPMGRSHQIGEPLELAPGTERAGARRG
jgi:hypothetical protein